jgi:NACHT domain-containing protein
MASTLTNGDEFRDRIAALLRTRFDNVRTEIQLAAKKADICFEIRIGPHKTIAVGAECKKWNRGLTRDDVKDIINDYTPAINQRQIHELWIICDRSPAAGARDYAAGFQFCQIMTALEAEQTIIDFIPLLNYLARDFDQDPISKYFIPPNFDGPNDTTKDLHTFITDWLADDAAKPIAIWGGYGMGKTSYARFLSATLARKCLTDYGSRIPILLNLGDFTTAPDLESLIFSQLANLYGVRNLSAIAFRILNRDHRFVLILDGFDEMKFAMAPNEFNYISSEIRKVAAVNSKLILLGRPGSIETEEEEKRLTSSKLQVQHLVFRADDAPDFFSLRLSLFAKEQYLRLIRNFLTITVEQEKLTKPIDQIISAVEALNLGDILSRPVQAKMLAEVVADPGADISSISRFTLYDMFIRRVLRREEEKSARRQIGTSARLNFMRLLAWWLWTDKKTRTFVANEIPIDIIERFKIEGVPIEGLRRELLIGSVLEERHIGLFLSEKTAGVFYFPHTSFTEFLVADYIMSSDFLNIDVSKLPNALYGEVPTFLDEHPSKDAIFAVYGRMKAANIAMTTSCMSVLLNNFKTRLHVELVNKNSTDPWDICLHYFLLRADNAATRARQFALECLASTTRAAELAAMFCLMYEETLTVVGRGSAIARMVLHIVRKVGLDSLITAAERGSTTVRSSELNHLAQIVSSCMKIVSRDLSISFDFAEFTNIALNYFGTSCAVADMIETMRKIYNVPLNDLFFLTNDSSERAKLDELLRKGGNLEIIPSLA